MALKVIKGQQVQNETIERTCRDFILEYLGTMKLEGLIEDHGYCEAVDKLHAIYNK